MLGMIGSVFAGLSLSSYTFSSSSYEPGASGVLTLVVENTNTGTSSSDDYTAVKVSTIVPAPVTIDDEVFIGDLDSSTSTTVSIPFTVDDRVDSQIYIIELRLYGTSKSSATRSAQSYFKSSFVPISIVQKPVFSMQSDNDVLYGVQGLKMTLINNGGIAKNVKISIPSSNFAFSKSDQVFIKQVNGSATFDVLIDSRNAQEGPNDLNFSVTYDDAVGTSHTDTLSLRVTVKKEKLDLDISSKNPLVTKEEGDLALTIINNGNSISDVRLYVSDPNMKLQQINEIQLGDMASKSQKEVTLRVFPEYTPGLNGMIMTVKWYEGNVQKEKEISVPVKITSDADVHVYLEAKPTPLKVDQEHTISVLVSNVGSFKIDNVDVSISSDSMELLDVQNKEYIGSLDPDDFSTVQFKVKVKSVDVGIHNMLVTVNYRDNSGQWSTKEINSEILVNPADTHEGGLLPIILVVVVLAMVVWYFKFRKK
ncbi:MAG: hypothetical protein ABII22_00530 [Candidatus Micrarchaeota archaeon]